jgi:hypothetical protein
MVRDVPARRFEKWIFDALLLLIGHGGRLRQHTSG